MKKFVYVTLILLLVGGLMNLFAQGIYLKGQAGYAFGINKHYFGDEDSFTPTGDKTAEKDIYHSFGKGLKFLGAIGFPMMPGLAFQLESGLSMLGGLEMNDQSSFNTTYTTKYSTMHIPILASMVVSANMNNLRGYAGAGAGIYFFMLKREETNSQNDALSEWTYRFNLPIGFHGFIGFEFPMGPGLAFYGELRVTSLTLMLKEEELTKMKDNFGNEVDLNELPEDQKIIKFKKDSIDDPAPWPMPASSLGAFFGIRLNL